jgi:hypothetical protein
LPSSYLRPGRRSSSEVVILAKRSKVPGATFTGGVTLRDTQALSKIGCDQQELTGVFFSNILRTFNNMLTNSVLHCLFCLTSYDVFGVKFFQIYSVYINYSWDQMDIFSNSIAYLSVYES